MNINEINNKLDQLIIDNNFIVDVPSQLLTGEMYDGNEVVLMVNYDVVTRVYLINPKFVDKEDVEIMRFTLPINGKKLQKAIKSSKLNFERLHDALSRTEAEKANEIELIRADIETWMNEA